MKLNPTLNKLSLMALLSLGLACSPLVASADDDHDRHEHHQQDRDRDYRGYQNDRRHDKRRGYSKHKKSHPVKSHDIHHWRNYKVRPYLIRHHRNVVIARPYGQWCL